MKKYLSKGLGFLVLGSLFLGANPALAAENPITQPATDLTPTSATINGTNGDFTADASTEAFWYGTLPAGALGTPFTVGVVPPGWTGGIYADNDDENPNGLFDYSWTGLTPNTTYYYVAWVSVGGTWYPGSEVSFTTPSDVQTINFGLLSDKTYGDADFSVSATGGASGNPVTFSTASTACSVTADGSVVDVLTVGTCTITANQAAGGGYNAATPVDQSFTINPKSLTISGVTVDSKVYDKTTDADLTFTSASLNGVVAGDEADVLIDSSLYVANFDDADADTNIDVTVSGIALTGPKASNYTLTQPTTLDGDITPRPITITAVTDTKVYNGNANSSGVPTLTSGTLVGGDDILGFTQSYDNKNVGTGKTLTPAGTVNDGNGGLNYNVTLATNTTGVITAKVLNVVPSAANKVYNANTVATISFTDDRVPLDVLTVSGTGSFATKTVDTGKVVSLLTAVKSGTDAGNYTLVVTPTVMLADITAAPLVPVVTAANKVYDGNTTASATCTVSALTGDVVTCSVGAATWDTKDAGINKTVTATGITIGGADAANYTVATSATDTADITAKPLTISFTADNKVYDGNTSAAILTRTATGMVGAETVVVSGGTATFNNKNFGTGKVVTGTGFTLNDSNYSVGTINTTTANITKRALAVTATGVNRVYNGNTTATVTFSDNRVSGDNLTITGTATFADKHVGTNKPVSVTGIVVGGTDAGNYTANTTTSTTANITPLAITVTGAANSRVYNATTLASALPTVSPALVGTDTAVVSETYDNKNVGTGKTMIPAIVITDGNGGNNYTVTLTNSTNGTITVAPVTVAFTANPKVYDGNTSAVIATRTVTGNIAPDPVITATGGTATFNNENVGTRTVNASGFTLSDSNYAVTVVTPTTANITAKTLAVTASATDKVYDATTGATVTFSDDRVAGDVFTVTGVANFVDKNVGNNKTVNVTGIAISGTDAGNYTQNTTTTTDADIAQRDITVSATALDKVYDDTTVATVTLSNNAVLGDVVTQTYTTADFDNENVGVAKLVTVSGITIAGTDVGNYNLTSTTATTNADITDQPSSGGGSRPRPKTTTGQVLGATTTTKFTFTQNMKQGSVGNEVMELQKFLNNAGFGTLVVDGKFGPMTRAAVVKFQLANGLVGDGVVGPLTRAVLNK